jgi:hypothetical protein
MYATLCTSRHSERNRRDRIDSSSRTALGRSAKVESPPRPLVVGYRILIGTREDGKANQGLSIHALTAFFVWHSRPTTDWDYNGVGLMVSRALPFFTQIETGFDMTHF